MRQWIQPGKKSICSVNPLGAGGEKWGKEEAGERYLERGILLVELPLHPRLGEGSRSWFEREAAVGGMGAEVGERFGEKI